MKAEIPKLENTRLNKKLVKNFVLDLYKTGVLTDDDIKDSDTLFAAVKKFISKSDSLVRFVLDHREILLQNADFFISKKQYELARLFYATYFEHTANSIISTFCAKNNIKLDIKKDIIRSTSLNSKYSWLLVLFKLPKLKSEYFQIIIKLSDDRNAFIHYKWIEDPSFEKYAEEIENDEKKLIQEFIKIKQAVKYIKVYESKIYFKGNKKKIKKSIR